MRFQPIIVPGWRNSGPDHWQSLWMDRLPNAVRVQQHDWEQPDPVRWTAGVAQAVDAASCPALLIAHSLGCLAVARLPVALRHRVAGALLVAPADVERTDAPAALRGFAPVPDQPLGFQSVVVASDDDPCCRLERARVFAHDWGSRLVVLQQAGHINAESGHGSWPEGLKLLAALRRRAVWRVSPPGPRIPPVPGAAGS
ncbi:alpha/beta hydrolase [Orrella sp. JC864]|uniref:RBBP9/YdeN family alpha/beta hydrolase n=1 Tax=Orrella sp. JC864 TaxID=3120298 RepID=UPI0012BCCC8A